MMNRKEFYEYVNDNVKEYLPESYKDAEIKLQEVEKNNGLKLTGITIPNGDQRIVPRVYLDSFYLEYVIGKDLFFPYFLCQWAFSGPKMSKRGGKYAFYHATV